MNSPILTLSHSPYIGYGFEGGRYFTQQSTTPPEDLYDDESQVPSPAEFDAIVADYLNNLSPKKRDKALVDQQRYCLIQQVLRDPRNTAISTAQFRFWVKKMFQLQQGSVDLVCHDNKPVAMKEQIYSILVKAHRDAHHGGRDKTSALVRKQFSWIPKELVARFVRHCPFCITRRNSGQSLGLFASKAPTVRTSGYVTRHSFGGFEAPPVMCTPSVQEDSDLSSGPSSTENGYDASPNYSSMSSASPRRTRASGSFSQSNNTPYDRDEDDLLPSYPFGSSPLQKSMYSTATNTSNNCSMYRTSNDSHPYQQRQSQQHVQSAPHSPLFYHQQQGYMPYPSYGNPSYGNPYYSNVLGISPCAQATHNQPFTTFMRPEGTDILDHQDHPTYLNTAHHYVPSFPPTNSSENTFASNNL